VSDENKEYPLYPALSEAAAEEAQQLMDGFKVKLKSLCEEVLGDLYAGISMYIESDHWQNYRNEIMDGMCDYGNRKVQGAHDFKRIRQAILKEHRADIIEDLNQDMVQEIAALKKQIEYMEESRRGYR